MGEEMVQIRADCGTWMLWIAIELRFCASGSSLHHVNSRVGTLGLCSGSLDCFHLFSCHMWNLPSIFFAAPRYFMVFLYNVQQVSTCLFYFSTIDASAQQDWVARNGWRLLPAYSFCVETGEWHHRLSTPQQAISRGQS